MSKILTAGGKLLITSEGKIRTGDECCCPDPTCPTCCSEIQGGEFNDDGDLEFISSGSSAAYNLVVTVSGLDGYRWVCDKQEITVTAELFFPSADPLGPEHKAFITWDRQWRYQGSNPSPDTLFELGLAKWSFDTANETGSLLIAVTLAYDKCYTGVGASSSEAAQLGDIFIEFTEAGAQQLIVMQDCMVDPCCVVPFACDSCCLYIDPSLGRLYEAGDFPGESAGFVMWQTNAGFSLRIKITDVQTNDDGTVAVFYCNKVEEAAPNTLAIEYEIVPDPDAPDGLDYEVTFDHTLWHNVDFDLPEPPSCEPAGTPDYQTINSGRTGDIELYGLRCDEPCYQSFPGNVIINAVITDPNDATYTAPTLSLTIEPLSCDQLSGIVRPEDASETMPATTTCRCCCPNFCCGDCHFPVSNTIFEQADTTYDDNPKVRIVGLYSSATTPAGRVTEYRQNQDPAFPTQSLHRVNLQSRCGSPSTAEMVCASSNCDFVVHVERRITEPDEAPGDWERSTPNLQVRYNNTPNRWTVIQTFAFGAYGINQASSPNNVTGCEGLKQRTETHSSGTVYDTYFTVERDDADDTRCPIT